MDTVSLPPDAWDCHIHCFDPVRYPFSQDRTYTPTAAPLEQLAAQTQARNLVLVQASIEDGPQGLLTHLTECRARFPSLNVRGIICNDNTNLTGLAPDDFQRLHELGIRSIRIHGFHSTDGDDVSQIETQIRALSRGDGVRKYGWSISAQLPLRTWALLSPFILSCSDIAPDSFIADHSGCSTPRDIDTPALDSFMGMLKSGRVHVKLGALHRRSPGNIQAMRPIVTRFATEAPQSVLWGSDWPHVDSSKKGLEISDPHPDADVAYELRGLRAWLTEEQWRQMFVDNPHRVFGDGTSQNV